ncbi:MAG: hypothetical protein R3C59_31165 [Planctomycetaceae bacterium]
MPFLKPTDRRNAVDQTSQHESNIDTLISLYPDCSFLITLREETLSSKSKAWGKRTYDDVTALPFSEGKARRYLGDLADSVFTLLKDQDNKEPGSILTVPLLLSLQQLNVVTARTVFEDSNSLDAAWRHRSFFEFLGGCALAEMLIGEETEREQAREFLEKVHRFCERDDTAKTWHWTFRFALCPAKQLNEKTQEGYTAEERVALELIRFGNPMGGV